MDATDRTGILAGSRQNSTATDTAVLYHDSSQSPKARMLQLLFVSIVVLMVVITVILSIYRGVVLGEYGGLYFMLGICLLGFVAVEIILVVFIRKGDLPKGKLWFLYFMGVCVMLEAIFTNVLLFK